MPGGVLVVATVAMVPTVGQAFERLIGVWPSVLEDGLGILEDFKGALFALALATIAAGLIAFSLVGFPFAFSHGDARRRLRGAVPRAGARRRAEPRRPRDAA